MQFKSKLVMSLALSALLVAQTSSVGATSSNLSDKDSVFMSVNDKQVKEEELYNAINLNASYTPALEVVDMKVLKAKYQDDPRLEKMINEKYQAKLDEAKETDKDLKKAYASFGAIDKNDFIDKSGILLDSYRELARIDTAKKEIFSQSDLDYIYKNRISGQVDIYHLLVAPKVSSLDANNEDKLNAAKDNAKKQADKIISELDGGLSFNDAVKKYSDDKSTTDGKLGNFNVDSAKTAKIDTAIAYEAFNLKDGTYSAVPVLSDFGYEIVFVKVTKEKESYKNVENDVAKKLYDIYYKNNVNIAPYVLDLYRENNKVELFDSAMIKAYANSKINNRKTYIQFDPSAQQDPYSQYTQGQ